MGVDSIQIYLASSSPQRFRLLKALGLEFTVVSGEIDETPHSFESVPQYVMRLAEHKSVKSEPQLANTTGQYVIVGADTCVTIDDIKLGKPADIDEARQMLLRLSGRTHQVYSAVAVTDGETTRSVAVSTEVEFHQLTIEEIEIYLASGEAQNRAGSYAIQGLAGSFVKRLSGSLSSVIGLPVKETIQLLSDSKVTVSKYRDIAKNVEGEFQIRQSWHGDYWI